MCLKKLKKMNTPNKMTESVEEGALIEIKENFRKINTQKTQSSEQFFDLYSAETELNFETKFNQFIGDSEDSTEISDIVSNLCFSSSSSSNYPKINSSENDQKQESDADSENIEILRILKRSPQTTKYFASKGHSRNAYSPLSADNAKTGFSAPARPIAIKKISLAGRVLKGFETDGNSCETSPQNIRNFNENLVLRQALDRPERSSNPIFKNPNNNNNFNENDNIFFFEQFQTNNKC